MDRTHEDQDFLFPTLLRHRIRIYVGLIITTKSIAVILVSWVFLAWFVYNGTPRPKKRTYEDGVRDAAKAVLGVYKEHMRGNVIANTLTSRGQILVVASRLALDLIGEAKHERVSEKAQPQDEPNYG